MKESGVKTMASNRKARHDFFVEDKIEAGIALSGTEVKSVRAGGVNLKDSFCVFKDGECYLRGARISPYEKGNIFNRDPERLRKLLLHKREIRKLASAVERSGYTVVPLSVYLKNALVKVELGLCKGKKDYDKRDSINARDSEREIARVMKNNNRYNRGGFDE
ncbi:MAG: SsrA-binding protein SmpB [Oscillospiraceae bacterium]|jgi:SsrA-binding protein|nr:SsrA-binding protein SmpB [Oscillospiraceae bacterium]